MEPEKSEKKMSLPRLLPVVYFRASKDATAKHEEDRSKCIFLLRALRITQDPKRLAQMMGFRNVVEVFRTLDKMAMRKEYHSALIHYGIDFPYIVKNYKDIVDNGKDRDRLGALNALLKSVGMDEYKASEVQAEGGWEDILGRKIEALRGQPAAVFSSGEDYEVVVPAMPASAKMLSTSADGKK